MKTLAGLAVLLDSCFRDCAKIQYSSFLTPLVRGELSDKSPLSGGELSDKSPLSGGELSDKSPLSGGELSDKSP